MAPQKQLRPRFDPLIQNVPVVMRAVWLPDESNVLPVKYSLICWPGVQGVPGVVDSPQRHKGTKRFTGWNKEVAEESGGDAEDRFSSYSRTFRDSLIAATIAYAIFLAYCYPI